MRISLINNHLSRPRFNRYLAATGNNSARARRLYSANLRLAQAFHPLLSQFEVVLRNKLNAVLTHHFGDADWIINQKNGFMHDPSLANSRYFMRSQINKSETNLNNRGIPITSGKIISDQTFGFWVSFFLAHHYGLIGGQPIYVFPGRPATENRASLYDKLDDIRNFRNRVNHCEPLCFVGNTINCAGALAIRTTLYNLVSWIEPDLVPFFQSVDNIPSEAALITRI